MEVHASQNRFYACQLAGNALEKKAWKGACSARKRLKTKKAQAGACAIT
jgi:hypothetical protein